MVFLKVALRTPIFRSTRSITAALAVTAQDVLKNRGDLSCVSTLKNGFRVASYNNGRPTSTVGVWIESGSRYETTDNNGVASFFEHLLYSGTAKRPATQLQSELAKIGARMSSFTDRERTAYYVQCLSGDVEKVVEILADVMRNTTITDGKVEEYRKVLLQKLDESDSDYRGMVFDNLHATAFQGTTFGQSPLGKTKTISQLAAKDIMEFMDDCYKPVRMVLTGVGNIDHTNLEKMADKYFGDLDNSYKRKMPQKSSVRFTGSEFHFRNDYIPYMYGAVAVEGVSCDHIDYWALQVVNAAVGQWDKTHATSLNSASSLVQRLCTFPELISFENFSLGYDNSSLFGYYVVLYGTDIIPDTEICHFIQREWRHFGTGVTDEEVERAKNKLKTNLFLTLEDNTQIANHISSQVLRNGQITPLAEIERRITYINTEAVRTAVMNHIYDRDIAIAGVGRTEAFPNYYHLRYAMSWWRL